MVKKGQRCTSFAIPQKNNDKSPVNTATSLVDAGEYRLALRTLKDCDALFADALRMEAYNGLNRAKKAIRYGVEYQDELGRQHIKDSTVSLSSYVSTEVQDVLNRNWKYASRQIQKRLAGQECNTQLQMMLGSLYQKNGLYNEAMEDYSKAAKANPNNAEAYFGRCAVLYRQGKLDDARDEYGKGIKIDPAMECLEYDDELMDIVTEFSRGI